MSTAAESLAKRFQGQEGEYVAPQGDAPQGDTGTWPVAAPGAPTAALLEALKKAVLGTGDAERVSSEAVVIVLGGVSWEKDISPLAVSGSAGHDQMGVAEDGAVRLFACRGKLMKEGGMSSSSSSPSSSPRWPRVWVCVSRSHLLLVTPEGEKEVEIEGTREGTSMGYGPSMPQRKGRVRLQVIGASGTKRLHRLEPIETETEVDGGNDGRDSRLVQTLVLRLRAPKKGMAVPRAWLLRLDEASGGGLQQCLAALVKGLQAARVAAKGRRGQAKD